MAYGYPDLAPVIPDMVEWLKSTGLVGAQFAEFIASTSGAALDPVRKALAGHHETQLEQLMLLVLPHWPSEDLAALGPELEQHLQRPSIVGLNVFALALLQQSGVNTHAPIDEWANLFRRRVELQLKTLDAIRASPTPA